MTGCCHDDVMEFETRHNNHGRQFANFLLSRKLAEGNENQANLDDKISEQFLYTMQIWFSQLASNGHINEMCGCMETALDVFKELRTDILTCTANILFLTDYHFQASQLYRVALKASPNHYDIREDFEQTCNSCVQRWHFRMLNDFERNNAFFKAISKAVNDGYKDVLDIGSGTGILSLFAASCGATSVLACEASDAMFAISQEVVAETKFQEQIKLVNKMSTDLSVGEDFKEKFPLVVTEIFDCGLFGEGIIPTLRHAWKDLLRKPMTGAVERKSKVIPSGARIYAFLVESLELRKHSRSSSSLLGLNMDCVTVVGRKDPEDATAQPYTTENLKYLKGGYKALSPSVLIMDINFNDSDNLDILTEKSFLVDVPVIEDGCVDAIAVWFELQLDESIKISSSPDAESCWEQAIYHLENENHQLFDSVFLSSGSNIHLKCSCNEQYLQIFVSGFTQNSDALSSSSKYRANDQTFRNIENEEALVKSENENDVKIQKPLVASKLDVNSQREICSISLKLQETRTPTIDVNDKLVNIKNNNEDARKLFMDSIKTRSLCTAKMESNERKKTYISTDRRKVARLNDETYLQAYKSAISLAVQTKELSNNYRRIDVLCLCGKMSLIPMLIAQRGNLKIHVLCENDTQLLQERIAQFNGIDLQCFVFSNQSLVDVAQTANKFDIVVMEIVDENGLLSQRLFNDVILIRTFLLKENGILLPKGFSMEGSMISSPIAERENAVHGTEKTMGFQIGKFINEFKALIAVKNTNYVALNTSSSGLGWGLLKTSIKTKEMDELKRYFSQLDRSFPQCGIDDIPDSSTDGFHQEWYKLGNKVLKPGHSAAARQFAKQGCPTGLRKEIWMCMFGLKIDNLDVLYYEQLKNDVFSYDLLVDRLTMKDVRLTTTNDDSFFVFEDLLYQVLLVFSRDTWLLERCSFMNSAPPKSYIKGKLGVPECQVCYPPSGVIPFHGFAMYAAPLCYIYEESMMLFYVFRELYVRYFSRLHIISSDSQGIVALCCLFEKLLQSQEPWLCKHFMDIEAQPLRIIFNWLVFGFSGYLATDQTLQLWDRVLGFDSLELLSVLAVAILSYRRDNLMAADSPKAIEAVLADLSTIKVIPVLVSFLSGQKL